jgi:hypothetical protein
MEQQAALLVLHAAAARTGVVACDPDHVLDPVVSEAQSIRTIRSKIDVARWLLRTPTVDEVCPSHCPICGAAARPPGGKRGLHGHGLRDRQLHGPPKPMEPPRDAMVPARRYLCQHCPTVLTVVPAETVPRRHYMATAIAFALGLFGIAGRSQVEVREQVSTARVVGAAVKRRWVTVSRWIDAVHTRELFEAVPAMPSDLPRREVAARAAMAIGAHPPPMAQQGALEVRAFFGAAHMA